jgi:PIN domain nuclease of toxin-antitoxin system
MPEQPLVLDTHIWIWAVTGNKAISTTLRQRINVALQKSRVLVPAICVWEVGMLANKSRIQLKEPLLTWVSGALEKSGFTLLPINEAIAVEACLLPGDFHNDPADRIIVASARIEKAILVTRDSRILEYGETGYINTLDI